jgi:hypothetical protein
MSFTKTHKCKRKLYRATSRAEEVARDWPLSECLEEGAVGISEEGEARKEERPTARKKDVVRVMRREKRGEEEDQSRGVTHSPDCATGRTIRGPKCKLLKLEL